MKACITCYGIVRRGVKSGADPVCALRLAAAATLAVAIIPIGTATAANPAVEMPPAVDPVAAHVAEAARRFGIPEGWIWAVMRAESGGQRRATSSAGAMGLMQIMPATWGLMRARYGLGPDPYDAHDNIMAGAAFLHEMHVRYDVPGFLAAYNAGPGRYDDYLAHGRPLPTETVAYVTKLAPMISGAADGRRRAVGPPDPLAWTRAALFAARSNGVSRGASNTSETASDVPPVRPSADRGTVTLAAIEPPSAGLFVPVAGEARR